MSDRWQHVSAAPTIGTSQRPDGMLAEDLFAAPEPETVPVDERLRQAYYWLVNTAVISPYYDVEFGSEDALQIEVGDAGATLRLPADASYASNVLLPLLTFAVGGKCLLIGGPGRGKTTIAALLGVLAGDTPDRVRRNVQQGQPQLTVSDLVGIPLPKDIVNADRLTDIRIAWRDWLTRGVKIIDEYNRIPTKTQSALLTMVAEGYVASHDQIQRTAERGDVESWYFTANDDAGGGTFAVIAALRDRIDVTVPVLGFNMRFLDELIARVEADERPEDHLPPELVFSPEDRRVMAAQVRAVPVPDGVRRHLEHFASHFELAQHGGRRLEYRTKDTVLTSGGRVEEVIAENSGADLEVDLGAQTATGLSVRALQTLIRYGKAMAYFRGSGEVTVADISAVLPFVLRGKLEPNADHPLFESDHGPELLRDGTSWLRQLFEHSVAELRAQGGRDAVGALLAQLREGLDGVDALEVSRRLTAIEAAVRDIAGRGKLYGTHFDDLLALKYLHQRYSGYARWLRTR